VREGLAFGEETLPAALTDLKSREGVVEAVIRLDVQTVWRSRHHRRRLCDSMQSSTVS